MIAKIDRLAGAFAGHVAIGWPASSSGSQRVIMIVYDPGEERALRRKLDLFAQGARAAGKSWTAVDLTPLVARWLEAQRYRELYFAEPDEFAAIGEDRIAAFVAGELEQALAADQSPDAIVAAFGVGSLFGFASVSTILSRVEHAVRGRLVVFFPGAMREGRYRLLDARESWDYHAVAITLDERGEVR
jgi:hypothetical protein